jgi:hypothetical protein
MSELFERLRNRHFELDAQVDASRNPEALCDKVRQFIADACWEARRLLDVKERNEVAGFLAHWASFLHVYSGDYPETTKLSFSFTPQECTMYHQAIKGHKEPDLNGASQQDYYLALRAARCDDHGNPTLEYADLLDLARTSPRLILLGLCGFGKTACLAKLAQADAEDGTRLPILVSLAGYQGDLTEIIRKGACKYAPSCFEYATDVQRLLETPNVECHFMFDGLTEIPTSLQERALAEIVKLMADYPQHRYLVTSRQQGSLWPRLYSEAMPAYAIQMLDTSQVREYLAHYLGADLARKTYAHLNVNPRIKVLAHIPLFLWMLTQVAIQGEHVALPRNRGQLLTALLDNWMQETKVESGSIPLSVQRQALAQLAYGMFRIPGYKASLTRLLGKRGRRPDYYLGVSHSRAKRILRRVGSKRRERGYDSEAILKAAAANSLITDQDEVRFWRLPFQDFFAAQALQYQVESWLARPWGRRLWLSLWRWLPGKREPTHLARNTIWWDVFITLAGITRRPTWLIRQFLRVNPWLSYWCFLEVEMSHGHIDGEEYADLFDLERRIEWRTKRALDDTDANKRRIALQRLAETLNLKALNPLITALGDPDPMNRNIAIRGLVDLGNQDIAEVELRLRAVLSDNLPEIRRSATEVLGALWRMPEVIGLGHDERKNREQAAQAFLAKYPKLDQAKYVEPLVALLRERSKDANVIQGQWVAAGFVGKMGKIAESPMMEFLEQCEPDQRWVAL